MGAAPVVPLNLALGQAVAAWYCLPTYRSSGWGLNHARVSELRRALTHGDVDPKELRKTMQYVASRRSP